MNKHRERQEVRAAKRVERNKIPSTSWLSTTDRQKIVAFFSCVCYDRLASGNKLYLLAISIYVYFPLVAYWMTMPSMIEICLLYLNVLSGYECTFPDESSRNRREEKIKTRILKINIFKHLEHWPFECDEEDRRSFLAYSMRIFIYAKRTHIGTKRDTN